MHRFNNNSKEIPNERKNSPHVAGELKFLSRIACSGMYVIEAGSNRGVTSIIIAKKIGKQGRLYAFEPIPDYYKELKENLERNNVENVSTYEMALINRKGRIRFYKRGEGSGITRSENTESLWVSATTIDDFVAEGNIGRIDLLNLDCEGSELLALQGAKAILDEQAPQIFCEIHRAFLEELGQSADDVISFLNNIDYEAQTVQVEDLDAETSPESFSHIKVDPIVKTKIKGK